MLPVNAIVCNNAIQREAQAAAQKDECRPNSPDDIRIDDVILAAEEGAACLRKVFAQAGRVPGIGLANLILPIESCR